MIIPTWLTARSATSPPRKADRNAAAETRNAVSGIGRHLRLAWQSGQSPNSSRRCSSTRNPVWRATSRTTERRPASSISVGPPAARADDVVVVGRLAADVGVLAGREVEALDGADLLEELERAEDGRRPTPECGAHAPR